MFKNKLNLKLSTDELHKTFEQSTNELHCYIEVNKIYKLRTACMFPKYKSLQGKSQKDLNFNSSQQNNSYRAATLG